MTQKIKLYGERHTNTNYLSKLIELNLDAQLVEGVVPTYIRTLERWTGSESLRDRYFQRTFSETLGWKHAAVPTGIDADEVVFVTLTKNPYAWLLSMYRRPYHQHYAQPPSLEEFLTLPWQTVGRENVADEVANPVQLWNLKNRSYFHLPSERSLHLRTEDTFLDASAVVARIAGTFAVPRSCEQFVDFQRSTKKLADRDGEYYRDYYLNERWRAQLTQAALDLINAELDADLLQRFDYPLITQL